MEGHQCSDVTALKVELGALGQDMFVPTIPCLALLYMTLLSG